MSSRSSGKERLKNIYNDFTGRRRETQRAQEHLARIFPNRDEQQALQQQIEQLSSRQNQQQQIQEQLSQQPPSPTFSNLSIQPRQEANQVYTEQAMSRPQSSYPEYYQDYSPSQLAELLEEAEQQEASMNANKTLLSLRVSNSRPRPRRPPPPPQDLEKYIIVSNILRFLDKKLNSDLIKIVKKFKLDISELVKPNINNTDIYDLDHKVTYDRYLSITPDQRKMLIEFIRTNLIKQIHIIRNELLQYPNISMQYLNQAKRETELPLEWKLPLDWTSPSNWTIGGRKKTYKRKTQIRRRTRKTTKNLSIRKRKIKRKRKTIRKNR